MIRGGFLMHPDPALAPAYKIGPFGTRDIGRNRDLPESSLADEYFQGRFPGRHFCYTQNGRSAISLALQHLGLQPDDCVTILTTTGNFYISGCVTREIEKYCRWSRSFEPGTRAILVNHEFGFCYEDLLALKQYGLPIIEDCAHAFCSDNTEGTATTVGDYLIYSLPKFFPIQFGGLLVSSLEVCSQEALDAETQQYLKNVVSAYLDDIDTIARQRRDNHANLSKRFEALGFDPRFKVSARSTPGVFMFCVPDERVDLPALKTFLWGQGIECSVFYGERAFFVPVHQRLSTADMDYFFEAVRYFVQEAAR